MLRAIHRSFEWAVALIVGASILLSAAVSPFGPESRVFAAGSCQLTDVSPHVAPAGTETGFDFTLTSTTDSIAWLQIVSPASQLSIDGASSDWLPTVTFDSTQATFSGSPINPNNPITAHLDVGVNYFSGGNWVVQVSTDPNGSSPFPCTGDASVTVDNSNVPPNISNVAAHPQSTTANVTWTTDKIATSEVDYGLTANYGSQSTDSAFVTSHTINLASLTPSTTYHYQVVSTDQQGHQASSSDGTFTTSAAAQSGGGSGGSSGGSGSAPIGSPVTDKADTTPPTISLNQPLPKIAATPPTISGTATDDVAVERVEYSTDAGLDWLPVDKTIGLYTKHVSFSFTPLNLDDDTYTVEVRAVDAGGNIAITPSFLLVIHEKPPTVGGYVLSLGPQVLEPDAHGVIQTLTGIDVTINLSTTGGATDVNISAARIGSSGTPSNFALNQHSDSGLWTGALSFEDQGTYQLSANAVDGANDKTSRVIGTIRALKPGLVISNDGPVSHATVTVYYLDPDTNGWVIWDGSPYEQPNPQVTSRNGLFPVLLPPGTYYVNASAGSYETFISSRFSLDHPTPLAIVLRMKSANFLTHLLTSWFGFGTEPLTIAQANEEGVTSDLVGTTLGNFSLANTAGATINPVDWLGKPTDLCVMATWAPTTATQLQALRAVSADKDIVIAPVGLQQNVAQLTAYNAIAGSDLPWLADPDNALTNQLDVGGLPTHYFVDRKGVIQQVTTAVLSPQQIANELSRL